MTRPVEECWLHLCGASDISEIYWELFVDIILVAAAASIPYKSAGFVEYAIIYLSIVNGWFLYVHHFASRFQEKSRSHSVLLWVFILGMVWGVRSIGDFQQFSLAMVVLRVAMFVLILRMACAVPRATACCALLAFFTSDSTLCYSLALSDRDAAPFLWGFCAVMELLVDFFLAVALSEQLQMPYSLQHTMDHFWAVFLAPLGALAIKLFQGEVTLMHLMAPMLLLSFGLLYYGLKEAAYEKAMEQSRIFRACLFIVLKLLGLSIWSVGACLMSLVGDETADLEADLGWSVGGALIWFLILRLFAGRPHDSQEILWVLACCSIALLSVCSVYKSTPTAVILSMYVVLVSILNIAESWTSLTMERRRTTVQEEEETRFLLPQVTHDEILMPYFSVQPE
jgi:hypothetical protein